MNIALWVLQVLLGLAFFAAGVNHGFRIEQARTRMAWMNDLPKGLLLFIGVVEILGGVGLILPAATGVLPWLTPLAAVGLAVVQILAALFHAARREYRNVPTNVVLAALAAFVGYGRFALSPL